MSEGIVGEYIRFFETMTRESVARLPKLVTDDIHFKDPFHDLHGAGRMQQMLERMFERLDAPTFEVTHCASARELWLLRWTFSARTKAGRPWAVEGMSELSCGPDGRINRHIDHWDAARQFYEGFPLLGQVLRLTRRLLSL